MAIKLLLNPAAAAKACTHRESGVTFMVRPIAPEQFEEIRSRSLDADKNRDIIKWSENFAVAAIADWGNDIGDKNGPLPCTEDNLRTFGRNQAINIMPWVIDQATGLEQFRLEEEAAAKNA